MYRVDKGRKLYGNQLAVLAGACLFIFFIFVTTAQQIQGDRQRALEAEVRQNQSRAQVFQQYVLRTLEMSRVATSQLADRLERGATSPQAAAGIIEAGILSKIDYVDGVAVRLGASPVPSRAGASSAISP